MPKITDTPTKKTISNRRWRENTADRYKIYKTNLATWYRISREFMRILDDMSGRQLQGRPKKIKE
jgi:tRNA(Ile2) C34 agmatinyltransferase TiaS